MAFFNLVISLIFIGATAHAHLIEINTNGYPGRFTIDDSPHYIEAQVLDLDVGLHIFNFVNGGSFNFTVSEEGFVVDISNTSVASGSSAALLLNTIELPIKTNDYSLPYTIGLSSFITGDIVLKAPLNIELSIETHPYQNLGHFYVSPDGHLIIIDGYTNIANTMEELNFISFPISIDTSHYPGWIKFKGIDCFSGINNFSLATHTYYELLSSSGEIIDKISPSTFTDNSLNELKTSYHIEGNSLKINTQSYQVTPPEESYEWRLYGHDLQTGSALDWLIPGKKARLYIDNKDYLFEAPPNCADFTVITDLGTFSFSCSPEDSLLSEKDLLQPLSKSEGLILTKTDAGLSLDQQNTHVIINGLMSTETLQLTKNRIIINEGFVDGPNEVLVNTTDMHGHNIQKIFSFWMGSGIYEVASSSAEVTIQLIWNKDQVDESVITLTSPVQDGFARFHNIPQSPLLNIEIL